MTLPHLLARTGVLVTYFFVGPLFAAMTLPRMQSEDRWLDFWDKNGIAAALVAISVVVGVYLIVKMFPDWQAESRARKALAERLATMPDAIKALHEDVKEVIRLALHNSDNQP